MAGGGQHTAAKARQVDDYNVVLRANKGITPKKLRREPNLIGMDPVDLRAA